jgi:hypothetical protein
MDTLILFPLGERALARSVRSPIAEAPVTSSSAAQLVIPSHSELGDLRVLLSCVCDLGIVVGLFVYMVCVCEVYVCVVVCVCI